MSESILADETAEDFSSREENSNSASPTTPSRTSSSSSSRSSCSPPPSVPPPITGQGASTLAFKIETMRKMCHAIDCASEEKRDLLWKKFLQLAGQPYHTNTNANASSSSSSRHAMPCHDVKMNNNLQTKFFSPVFDAWCKEVARFSKCIETLWNAFHCDEITAQEILAGNSAAASSCPSSASSSSRRASLQEIQTFLVDANMVYVPTPKSFCSNPASPVPPCALGRRESVQPSPFGSDFHAVLVQLKFLQSWTSTLDSLAPSYKSAIWRVAKVFQEFGTNHDITSFKKTIALWAQSPLEHANAIKLMFCAIGYLKNNGVLKHEFFYPDAEDALLPVFRSPETDAEAQTKRKRKKRKRESNEVAKENAPRAESPLNHIQCLRPSNAFPLNLSLYSAFRPIYPRSLREISVNHSSNNAIMPELIMPRGNTQRCESPGYCTSLNIPSSKRSRLDTVTSSGNLSRSSAARDLVKLASSEHNHWTWHPRGLSVPLSGSGDCETQSFSPKGNLTQV